MEFCQSEKVGTLPDHQVGLRTPPRCRHPLDADPPSRHPGIWSTSGWYASYCNVYLFCNFYVENSMKMKEIGRGGGVVVA